MTPGEAARQPRESFGGEAARRPRSAGGEPPQTHHGDEHNAKHGGDQDPDEGRRAAGCLVGGDVAALGVLPLHLDRLACAGQRGAWVRGSLRRQLSRGGRHESGHVGGEREAGEARRRPSARRRSRSWSPRPSASARRSCPGPCSPPCRGASPWRGARGPPRCPPGSPGPGGHGSGKEAFRTGEGGPGAGRDARWWGGLPRRRRRRAWRGPSSPRAPAACGCAIGAELSAIMSGRA